MNIKRFLSIVVFLLSFLSAHAQTNSQNDFLTIREAMDIVSYRRYHPLTDGDMDDLIKFTAKKYGYIEEDFLEGVGTCSFWQYIKNGYVVYDTAAEDFFVPYNKHTASAVAIVDCQGIETIDYDEVAISAELRVFSEHSRDILLSEMKDIGFRLMNSEDRFLTYVWQDYTIYFQKFVTRGHDCWEFDVRLNYHKYNTTKHVEFRDSTRTRNLKFSLDYPVKGNPILLRRIRTLMMEAIEPDLVYEEPMPRYSGDMSDGQALVNYYGRIRCKMLDTERYGSPATEITSVKVVGENDYYISFEVYRYSDYGASSNYREYGVTYRKSDGKRLHVIANPNDPKYKIFLNENLYFEGFRDRIELLEEYKDMIPQPEYEPYLIQNGVRFVYQQGEIAYRPVGFIKDQVPFSIMRDFLTDEVKDVLTPLRSDVQQGYQRNQNQQAVPRRPQTSYSESRTMNNSNRSSDNSRSYDSGNSKVYDVVEEMPQFPGGPSALFEYLSKNVKYPVVAEENGVQGRVIVTFVVERDGSITDVRVVKSVDPSLDKEAQRVLRSMPRWIPGKQNGSAVRVKYTVPVTFKLQDTSDNYFAWFVFGTQHELEEHRIISNHRVVDNVLLRDNDYFTKIDIRIDKEIKLYSSVAEVLSDHPHSSYTLERDAIKQYVLRITDPALFWSRSRHLVVLVR